MNLVYGSFCPVHEGKSRCPCRTLTTNASIWTAAELGDVDRLRKVVTEKGRRPDSLDPHGYTPLHLAAQNGRLSAVRYLLEVGASPDGVPVEAGGCGATPLHRAAFAGQLPCVRALLSAGAQPHATDASFLDMKTPVHKAAGQGHRDVCIALLEAGADPNAPDAAGNSALDVLDMSSPMPFESLPERSGDGDRSSGGVDGGTSSGRRGERDTACSVVVLSGGGARDWDGVRGALERYGGRRLRSNPVSADGGDGVDLGGGHDGGGDDAHGITISDRRSGGVSGNTIIQENVDASQTVFDDVSGRAVIHENVETSHTAITQSSWMEPAGVGLSIGGPVDPTSSRPSGCKKGDSNLNDSMAGGGAHATPRPSGGLEAVGGEKTLGILLEGAPNSSVFPAEEGGASAGIPCGECRLPKLVMKRAACCGALLCKACVRHISARRRGCRRCSGNDGA